MGWRDGMACVFLFIILARRWTGIIAVTASALADLTGHGMGLSRLKALLVGSDIGRHTCICCA
jgi:hypothetical protein